jgi:hypothetical protein
MSKSDVKINKALKIDVSDAEANIIFEAMCTQMNKDTKIDKMHIKAFVDFSLANDSRYVTALEYIKSFSATSLQTSCVIYLADFAKKSELLQEMKELAEVWGKTNPNLETAFNNCLK